MYNRKKIHRRVAFIAHALLPEDLSTRLFEQRLAELGRTWPASGHPRDSVPWLSFPFVPPPGRGQLGLIDVHVIPVLGPQFWAAIPSGKAGAWTIDAADRAVQGAVTGGDIVTVGFGALAKPATNHGSTFLGRNPALIDDNATVSSTHGDDGTAALVLDALRRVGVCAADRVAIIGAGGVIGSALAHCMPQLLGVKHLLLVGNQDAPGCTARREQLLSVQADVSAATNAAVAIGQDAERDCLTFGANVVIVSTNGALRVLPASIQHAALLFDITTPSACRSGPEWQERGVTVLKAGCGEFRNPEAVLPSGFGQAGGELLTDIGAGGPFIAWGCLASTISRASLGWQGHLVGPSVSVGDVAWSLAAFSSLGIGAQPPNCFGTMLSWSEVTRRLWAGRGIGVDAARHNYNV
jgi:hypothetical protein